jgi:hypothetical protein
MTAEIKFNQKAKPRVLALLPMVFLIMGTATIKGQNDSNVVKAIETDNMPDLVAKVCGLKGGAIGKNVLLAQIGVAATMEKGYDSDLTYRVIEFTVSTNVNGVIKQAKSKSYKFTKEQKQIFSNLNRGGRFNIQDIKCVAPDGKIRLLPTIAFLIR